jgi:hypothetical protein
VPTLLEFPTMEFFLKLTTWLQKNGVSQQQLAILTGIEESKISRLVTGKSKPFLADGLIIARALDLPLAWLADDTQPWPPPEGTGKPRGIVDVPPPRPSDQPNSGNKPVGKKPHTPAKCFRKR